MVYDWIVVGAGLAGLTAAFYLSKRGKRVLLLEAAPRPGGSVRTLREGPFTFEEGPQTILANNEAVWRLVADLGLDVQRAAPSSKKRFIYKGGKPVSIPLRPDQFFLSPLLSWRGKLRLLGELFVPPSGKEDESVASFTRRRFGEEFLRYFVQPFVSGIYAGDAERLSVRYAFPKLWETERRYGSLLKAFFKERRVAPKGELISFKGGLETLVSALSERIGEKLFNARVEALKKEGREVVVFTERGTFRARRVALTVPAYEAARLLRDLFPEGLYFEKVNYPPVAVVSLAFEGGGPEGFGILVPKGEGPRILGAIFVHSLFPDRCPEGHSCFSVFLCGETQGEVCNLSEEKAAALAERELRRIFPRLGRKVFSRARVWRRSIPQYEVGYGRIYELLEELKRKHPEVAVISSFVGGSSAAKAVEKGLKLAEESA
ncbi:MAG: protoporphyrinogen oxidase [Aquificae bacterium]|nr:protoporphyrinogen oxidase [Aquificota bacterium]